MIGATLGKRIWRRLLLVVLVMLSAWVYVAWTRYPMRRVEHAAAVLDMPRGVTRTHQTRVDNGWVCLGHCESSLDRHYASTLPEAELHAAMAAMLRRHGYRVTQGKDCGKGGPQWHPSLQPGERDRCSSATGFSEEGDIRVHIDLVRREDGSRGVVVHISTEV